MGEQDAEYVGLMARSWDLLRGDTSGWADRAFYVDRIAASGEPVLDVGCGTGRLLLDYAAQGIDIDGVDTSADMLALCRNKAERLGLPVRVYEQSVEAMDLPRRYRTILIPSSTLQLITDPSAAADALRAVLAHLLPGGEAFASIMTLWKPGDPLVSEWDHSVMRPEDSATVRRLVRTRYDPEDECEHTDDLYQVIVDGQVVEEARYVRSPATRSYSQAQVKHLFEAAGFVNVRLYSEFTEDPVKPDDTLFVVGAQRQNSGHGLYPGAPT